jgi:hypothetical protein
MKYHRLRLYHSNINSFQKCVCSYNEIKTPTKAVGIPIHTEINCSFLLVQSNKKVFQFRIDLSPQYTKLHNHTPSSNLPSLEHDKSLADIQFVRMSLRNSGGSYPWVATSSTILLLEFSLAIFVLNFTVPTSWPLNQCG